MKNLILFTILIASGLGAFAQAPVIDSTWLPTQGNNYYDFNIAQPPHGRASDTGANFVWDYSDSIALKPYPDDTSMFVFPATRNISCNNPASNLAKGNSSFHHCYIKNSYGLYETGSIQSIVLGGFNHNVLTTNYTKPELLEKSDFHFRDSVRDSSYYTYNLLKDAADSNYRTINIKTINYDGYGTLKFGGFTFDSTLRVHTHFHALDTVYYRGGYIISLGIEERYEWYKKSQHAPVLTLFSGYSTSNIEPTPNISSGGFYSLPVPHNSSISNTSSPGYPNIRATYSNDGIVVIGIQDFGIKFSLYDAKGRLLQTGSPQRAGNNKYIWKAANLSPGVYLLKVNGRDGKEGTVKIVKSTQE